MNTSTNKPIPKTKTMLQKKEVNVQDNFAKYTFVLRPQVFYISGKKMNFFRPE